MDRHKDLGDDLFRSHYPRIVWIYLADWTGDMESLCFDPGKELKVCWLAGVVRSPVNRVYHFPARNLLDLNLPVALYDP